MSTELESSFEHRVVVLGNDAQLYARPATPVQLAQACLAAGYTFVAPASWGDELIAMHAIDTVSQGPAAVSVLCQCPFVAESLRALPEMLHPVWTTVSPPVAVARYLRAAFAPHVLHITYVGSCPGATAADIDARFLPENFIARLIDLGIVPGAQSTVYESMLPPDRSRFASLAGGIPYPDELQRRADAELHEVVPITLEAVARVCPPNVRTLFALSRGSGCVCARDRARLAALEPPRSLESVVDEQVPVELVPVVTSHDVPATTRPPDLEESRERLAKAPPPAHSAATFDESGTPSPLASGVITKEERDAMSSAGYSAYWALPEARERDAPQVMEGGEKRASPPSAAPEGDTELGDPEAYPTFEPPSGAQELSRSDAIFEIPEILHPEADRSATFSGDRPWHDRLRRLASGQVPGAASLALKQERVRHLMSDRPRRHASRYPSEVWWRVEWRRTLGLLALGMADVFADVGGIAQKIVRQGSADRAHES